MEGMRRARTIRRSGSRQAGAALLSALWLSLLLGAIAFGVAAEVRTSAESAANSMATSQAKYFAEGGIYAAVGAIQLARSGADPGQRDDALDRYREGQRWLEFRYQSGAALVELVPENAKLSVNQLSPGQAQDLLAALGDAAAADTSAGEALRDWRSPSVSSVDSPFDAYYGQLPRPYRANHAMLKDLEELIAVKGFGREMFFGSADVSRDPAESRPSLLELLNAEYYTGPLNINYAAEQALAALPGWTPRLARDVVAARRDHNFPNSPFQSLDDLVRRVPAAAAVVGVSAITLNSGSVFTLTATGLHGGSGDSHTVRAIVRLDMGYGDGYRVLAWWDVWPWSPPPAAVMASLQERL